MDVQPPNFKAQMEQTKQSLIMMEQGGEQMPPHMQDMPVQGIPRGMEGGPMDQPIDPGQQMVPVDANGQPIPVDQNGQPMDPNGPFLPDQYKNVGLPDTPIAYQGGIAETLLNDNEVPKDIRKKYWYVFHKDNTLTFLDDKRKQSKLLNFDIAKIDKLHTVPYYDYDFQMEMDYGILRNVFETKLDRALGHAGGNVKNERIMLQSQFQEQRQIQENNHGAGAKDGFFKRLLGRR